MGFSAIACYFVQTIIGRLEEFTIDRVIAECKADAPTKTGWCKIRDAFVVPAAINIGMYVLKVVLEKAAAEG